MRTPPLFLCLIASVGLGYSLWDLVTICLEYHRTTLLGLLGVVVVSGGIIVYKRSRK